MTDDGFLCLNHGLNDEREAHFVDEKFLLGILGIDKLLDFLLFVVLFCSWLLIERRPAELLAADNVKVEVVDGLVAVLPIVDYDAIALYVQVSCNLGSCDHHVSK